MGFLGRRTCKGIFLVSVFISSLFPLVSFPQGWVLFLQRPRSLLSRTDLLFISAAGRAQAGLSAQGIPKARVLVHSLAHK